MNEKTELPLVQAKDAGCACGCVDEGVPALDARVIPHAIRHATIFGALDSLRPQAQLDLIAPHDPLPLLAQIAERHGDALSHEYLQQGPQDWVLRFTRQ